RGGPGAGRKRKGPRRPAATTMTPSATMRAGLRLGMRAPPLDEKRGNHRKHEVDSGKGPEAAPVMRHLPQAGAQLIDADEAVDGEVRARLRHWRAISANCNLVSWSVASPDSSRPVGRSA